jgi:hypothetical protein
MLQCCLVNYSPLFEIAWGLDMCWLAANFVSALCHKHCACLGSISIRTVNSQLSDRVDSPQAGQFLILQNAHLHARVE